MILYHGSNCDFNSIDISKAKDKRDFGKGFYTTTLYRQAEEWAELLYDRYRGDGIFVYEIDYTLEKNVSILKFDDLSDEWLLMVKKNRTLGGVQHEFDIVQGPVANDKTTRTIALYISNVINANEAIERLRFNRINDQMSFHTPAALSCIKILRKQKK